VSANSLGGCVNTQSHGQGMFKVVGYEDVTCIQGYGATVHTMQATVWDMGYGVMHRGAGRAKALQLILA
jgi:hypothetical protein